MNRIVVMGLAFLANWTFAVTEFELPWMNNEGTETTFNSAHYPDGIFVVEAYFLNCPYCNTNASNVDSLASDFESEPRVHVLDVSIDRQQSQYDAWIDQHKPNHPVLNDGNRTLIKQLGTSAYPSSYVINCKRQVVYSTRGVWNTQTKTRIREAIRKALLETCE